MTNKKTLLNEGTVRQFMKLANIEPLTPGFVEKLYEGDNPFGGNKDDREKDAPEDEHEDKETEEEEDKADYEDPTSKKGKKRKKKAEADRKDESLSTNPHHVVAEQEEELEIEDEVEVEEEGGGDVDVAALVRAIADAVEEHTGVSVDVADEEGGEEELGGEEEVELGGEEEVELGGEEEELGLEEEDAYQARNSAAADEESLAEETDLEEVISTIAENVTKRLQQMAKKKSKKLNEEDGMSMGVPGVDVAHTKTSRKRKGAGDWYRDIAKNIQRSFPEVSKHLDFSRNLQAGIDGLAKELGLKAGKDFRNFRQMKAKILDALTADVAQAEELPDMSSAARMGAKQSRKAGPLGPDSPGQSIAPIGKE